VVEWQFDQIADGDSGVNSGISEVFSAVKGINQKLIVFAVIQNSRISSIDFLILDLEPTNSQKNIDLLVDVNLVDINFSLGNFGNCDPVFDWVVFKNFTNEPWLIIVEELVINNGVNSKRFDREIACI
jgi:hypothetical protein